MTINLSEETIERTLSLINRMILIKSPLTRSLDDSVRQRALAEVEELRDLYRIYDDIDEV